MLSARVYLAVLFVLLSQTIIIEAGFFSKTWATITDYYTTSPPGSPIAAEPTGEELLLASILNDTILNGDTRKDSQQLILNIGPSKVPPILLYELAINRAYNSNAHTISRHLQNLAEVEDVEQNKNLQLVKEYSEFYLLTVFLSNKDTDNIYLPISVYRLKEFQQLFKYSTDPDDLVVATRIEQVIQTLPPSIKQLYFADSICLRNVDNNEYISAPRDLNLDNVADNNKNRRYVYTLTNNQSDETCFWDIQLKPKLSATGYDILAIAGELRDVFFKKNLFLDTSSENHLVTWHGPDPVPAKVSWKLIYENDTFGFEQNGYQICAGELVDNEKKEKRFLVGSTNAENSPKCRWYIDDCPDAEAKLNIE